LDGHKSNGRMSLQRSLNFGSNFRNAVLVFQRQAVSIKCGYMALKSPFRRCSCAIQTCPTTTYCPSNSSPLCFY
jgi:hypothetical protein